MQSFSPKLINIERSNLTSTHIVTRLGAPVPAPAPVRRRLTGKQPPPGAQATFNALLVDNPWPQRWMSPMSRENALSEVAGICIATDEYPGLFRSPITAIETQAFDEPCCRRRNRRQKALDLLLDILWQAQFRQDELLERRLLHCAKIPWFDPKQAVTRAFSRQYVGIYARCC